MANSETLLAESTRDSAVAVIPHLGCNYREFLRHLHRTLMPSSYLEIGTLNGGTLTLAECTSVAVDPSFAITSNVIGTKPACHFFQMRSDTFFRTVKLENLLADTIDLAFLDGRHLFEYLLRDFMNTERHCRPNSVIVMHDCLPPVAEMSGRVANQAARTVKEYAAWWAGDVWKIVPTLRKARPELRMIAVDCPPTGLVICTNLNPRSPTLSDRYCELLDEFGPLQLSEYGLQRLFQEADIRSSRTLIQASNLSLLFWT